MSHDVGPLGFDCGEQALGAVVQHLGGAKSVGHRLWPTMAADAAGRKLADCLNPARDAKLDLDEVIALLQWGRLAGCDTGMDYIAARAGYAAPEALDPEAEERRIELQLVDQLRSISEQIGALTSVRQQRQQSRRVRR